MLPRNPRLLNVYTPENRELVDCEFMNVSVLKDKPKNRKFEMYMNICGSWIHRPRSLA